MQNNERNNVMIRMSMHASSLFWVLVVFYGGCVKWGSFHVHHGVHEFIILGEENLPASLTPCNVAHCIKFRDVNVVAVVDFYSPLTNCAKSCIFLLFVNIMISYIWT